MKNKILHIMSLEKFIQPFIDFVANNFDIKQHSFFVLNKDVKNRKLYPLETKLKEITLITGYKLTLFMKLIYELNSSQKIIIHGLNSKIIILILFLQPWLLKKCYWAMWGGDFYFPEKQSWIKKQVIKRIGHCITLIPEEFEYVKKHYGCRDSQHYQSKCFTYLSNIYKETKIDLKSDSKTINIQIGNSADSTNKHHDILDILNKKIEHKSTYRIYAPLSYGGDKDYIKSVVQYGKKLFGENFIPLTDFMSLDEYRELLSKIDIAVFYHNRQQGLGNITTLLGMGKKVYLRNNVSTFSFLKRLGFKIFDFEDFDTEKISNDDIWKNVELMKKYFSIEAYRENLDQLFRS